jgi:hypothetical protein
MISNELKIELYPENKPITELKTEPIKTIINNETLGHSFDINENLSFLCYNVPTLSGIFYAYCNHYPIRIKPDDIWLLIVQCFSHHVNKNSESLRNYFVNFEGKKKLKIQIETLKIDKKDFETFVEKINQELMKYVGGDILKNLTPDFTTTDINTKLVCQMSIMDSFKKYFDYEFDEFNCGIPYIILEGVAEDYKTIISKAKELSKYQFEWYINQIIPIIQKMVEAKEGKIDVDFFKNIIIKKEGITYRDKDCQELKYKIDYLNGWITNFFGYYKEENGNLCELKGENIDRETINNLPSQILNIPFKIKNMQNNIEKEVKFEAGIFGCALNEKKEISFGIGWLVSPSYLEQKGKIDEQFRNLKDEYISNGDNSDDDDDRF